MASTRNNQRLEDLAQLTNPVVARLDELLRPVLSVRGVFRFCAISTRPSLHGRGGSTSGCDDGNVRPLTGWGASHDGAEPVCSMAARRAARGWSGKSRMRRESHRPVLWGRRGEIPLRYSTCHRFSLEEDAPPGLRAAEAIRQVGLHPSREDETGAVSAPHTHTHNAHGPRNYSSTSLHRLTPYSGR